MAFWPVAANICCYGTNCWTDRQSNGLNKDHHAQALSDIGRGVESFLVLTEMFALSKYRGLASDVSEISYLVDLIR